MKFVGYCPICGNIDLGIEQDKEHKCLYCNHETIITKYSLEEYFKNGVKISEIFEEYAKNSPDFDEELFNKREEKENAIIHGEGATVNTQRNDILKCPKCGSTAVSIGTRGFSLFTGFIGSGQTVNRCGKCGYKWKPKG